MESRLEQATREYESQWKQGEGTVTLKDIKTVWRDTEDTRTRDFNERLPSTERASLLAKEDAEAQQRQAWEAAQEPKLPKIEGIYLESFSAF